MPTVWKPAGLESTCDGEHCSLVQLLRSFLEILRILRENGRNKIEQVVILSTRSLHLGLVVLSLKSIPSLKKKKNPMSFECEVDGPNLSVKFKAMFKPDFKSGGGRHLHLRSA